MIGAFVATPHFPSRNHSTGSAPSQKIEKQVPYDYWVDLNLRRAEESTFNFEAGFARYLEGRATPGDYFVMAQILRKHHHETDDATLNNCYKQLVEVRAHIESLSALKIKESGTGNIISAETLTTFKLESAMRFYLLAAAALLSEHDGITPLLAAAQATKLVSSDNPDSPYIAFAVDFWKEITGRKDCDDPSGEQRLLKLSPQQEKDRLVTQLCLITAFAYPAAEVHAKANYGNIKTAFPLRYVRTLFSGFTGNYPVSAGISFRNKSQLNAGQFLGAFLAEITTSKSVAYKKELDYLFSKTGKNTSYQVSDCLLKSYPMTPLAARGQRFGFYYALSDYDPIVSEAIWTKKVK